MIKYSTALRSNPMKPSEPQKAYATAQVTEKISLSKFAAHIAAHNSAYDKGDIMAILTKAVAELREMLLEGRKVELGDLGEFFVTINSKPANSLAEFSSENIIGLNAKWNPGESFDDMLDDAEFEFSLTRKAEVAAKKTYKATVASGPDTSTGEEDSSTKDDTSTPKDDTPTEEGGSAGDDGNIE